MDTLVIALGARLFKKLTIAAAQRIVSGLLLVVGLGLILRIL